MQISIQSSQHTSRGKNNHAIRQQRTSKDKSNIPFQELAGNGSSNLESQYQSVRQDDCQECLDRLGYRTRQFQKNKRKPTAKVIAGFIITSLGSKE